MDLIFGSIPKLAEGIVFLLLEPRRRRWLTAVKAKRCHPQPIAQRTHPSSRLVIQFIPPFLLRYHCALAVGLHHDLSDGGCVSVSEDGFFFEIVDPVDPEKDIPVKIEEKWRDSWS